MKIYIQMMLILLAPAICTLIFAGEGEWQQSLDGMWQFSTNAALIKCDTIIVPGNWDTHPAYSTYIGKGWYRRDFTVPKDWAGKHIRLHFDAVYNDATVTLNGKELGAHSGGYTPFEFDVTGELKLGETNTVIVCADNTFRRGAWWHWGGISRSVSLIANNDVRIVWQHIRTEPDLSVGTAKIFVRYLLANAGAQPLKISLASQIDETPEAVLAKQRVTIPARGETVVDLETTLPKNRVHLWDFDHPNLYGLTTKLTVDGKITHEQSDHFGIRKIEVTKDSLLLNGERVRLCGFNRVSSSPETGNTESDNLVRHDVDLMKQCGANLMRIMHYPQAPNLLDYLDRKGVLIFEEIPVWGAGDPNMTSNNPLAEQWMSEMIDRDYNHPCIIGWSVGNELEHHFDYVKSMIDFTRALDPHRLITHVSDTGGLKDYNPTNDPISVSDIILFNTYQFNTYRYNSNSVAIVHAKWPDKPIFLSEFGVNQFKNDLDATIPGLESLFSVVTMGKPYVIGVSLWIFNDYRSNSRGTPPSGNRAWGVVDVDRRPKAAYEQVRNLFSPIHALELEGNTIRVVPRGPDEVPSFALRDYELRWQVSDTGGKILKSGVAKLPELKPGAPVWTMQLDGSPPGAIKVQLYTPTGYDVADFKGNL